MAKKKICVIVVTFNPLEWIEKCLKSIYNSNIIVEILIIDNNSNDGFQKILNEEFKEGNIKFIQLESNIGFGRANNIGLKYALENNYDYVFLLNQDVYLKEGDFESRFKLFEESSDLGIIAPIHFGPDEETLDFQFKKYIKGKENKAYGREIFEVDFVNAAAWLLPTKLIKKIGYFHPIFEHYGEDNEFVYRLKKKGLKICVDPKIKIVHDRPQNRIDSKYFDFEVILMRNFLLGYMKTNKFNLFSASKYYLKLTIKYLLMGELLCSINAIKYFIILLKKISILQLERG